MERIVKQPDKEPALDETYLVHACACLPPSCYRRQINGTAAGCISEVGEVVDVC